MTEMIRKVIEATSVKVLDEKGGRLEATLSTDSIDREGEVLDVSGWNTKTLKDRPPLIANHDYGAGGMFGNDQGLLNQLGHWENVRVEDNKLIGEPVYYRGMGNPQADYGYQLAKNGNAYYSVGFIPRASHPNDGADGIKIPFRTFTRMDLLECSHVIMPSNPDAQIHSAKGFEAMLRGIVKDIYGGEAFTAEEKTRLLKAADLFTEYVKANPTKFVTGSGDPEPPVEPEVVEAEWTDEQLTALYQRAAEAAFDEKRNGVLVP